MNCIVEFIIMAILFSIIVGGFIALCIVNTIIESDKLIIKWIVGIIIALVIGCSISGLILLQNKSDNEEWNNGYCTECNKPYKLTDVKHHNNGDYEYYYICDNCGHIIVTHTLRER